MISPLEGNGPRPWVLLDLHRPMLFKIMDEKSVLLCASIHVLGQHLRDFGFWFGGSLKVY